MDSLFICGIRADICYIIIVTYSNMRTAVAQWLRCCATYWKVAGSIPDGVIGIFHWHNPSRSHYGPGVNVASNRNEYLENLLGINEAGA